MAAKIGTFKATKTNIQEIDNDAVLPAASNYNPNDTVIIDVLEGFKAVRIDNLMLVTDLEGVTYVGDSRDYKSEIRRWN